MDKEYRQNKSELEKLKRLKAEVYQDFTSHLITEIDFLDLGKEINEKINSLTDRQKSLDLELESFSPKSNQRNEWNALIQQYCDSRELSKEMVDAFIEKIKVFENGNLEISFCFQNEFEAFARECKERLMELERGITVAG